MFLLASSSSIRAAIDFGALVKICFDVYLPELSKKLNFPPPGSLEEEQNMWRRFSQALIYRAPEVMVSRAPSQSSDDKPMLAQ
jgi:hypothetical protein